MFRVGTEEMVFGFLQYFILNSDQTIKAYKSYFHSLMDMFDLKIKFHNTIISSHAIDDEMTESFDIKLVFVYTWNIIAIRRGLLGILRYAYLKLHINGWL